MTFDDGVALVAIMRFLMIGCHGLIYLDNKAAIDSSYNPENHSRTKHIDRRHYFVRELVESNRIVVPYVPSDANLADFFTKPLRPSKFFPLRDKIMNVSPPQS